MPLKDVTLVKNPKSGKFTFGWGADGDLLWDDTQAYPVLTTLYAHKGEYFWDSDGTYGTYLHKVERDVYATGSQLVGYAQDGLDQVKSEQLIQGGNATAERRRPGSWLLTPTWQIHQQRQGGQGLRF